ncbi:hypothetical protein ACIRBX_22965 [Kitasatospora sp. NPDC096147]|uniref:hypothetical protein n=1 Tax=Kitasatospora sp. NPDC096147 TaxID=3364093 RepID=UPI0038228877
MSSGLVVTIAVVVLVAVVVLGAAALGVRRRQHPDLKRRFGPEYGRTVARHGGDTAAAEQELTQRVERHRELTLTPLSEDARTRADREWAELQAHFVDSPARALVEAEALLSRVARERGYPDSDVDAQIDAISVDHGEQVEYYRLLRTNAGPDAAGTEERRQALIQARELYAALAGADTARQPARSDAAPARRERTAPITKNFPRQREYHA